MNLIYNTGIALYAAAIKAAAPFHRKAALMTRGQARTFSLLSSLCKPGEKRVWVHAASLGEFEQGRPFIERLRREMPDVRIVLTFFSPSGYEVRKNFAGADVVCYLPFDTPANARRFVSIVSPVCAIFVKYEFWGNYLSALAARGIPVFLISAIFRPGQIFFRPWGGAFRRMLGSFTRIFVQDEASATLLASVTSTPVTVAGDTRFDRVTDVLHTTFEIPAIESFARCAPAFTLIAGSSWPQDENLYIPWVNSRPDVRLIIAPHEFDSRRIADLRASISGKCVTLSEIEEGKATANDARCIIVDCFGRLSSIYRYADAAYIGGGFGAGIHNINEAAVYGIPVFFGPRHSKFKEATDLLACGGALTFSTRQEFEAAMTRVSDPAWRRKAGSAAAAYIKANLGATDIVWQEFKKIPLLSDSAVI